MKDLIFFFRSVKGQQFLNCKIGLCLLLLVALALENGLQYRTSNFKRFICDDLATSCKYLVYFGPVTPEFKRVKGAHPSSISSLANVRLAEPVLGLAGISTKLSGAITTQFCFTYTLVGVTAMPRGLHAKLFATHYSFSL